MADWCIRSREWGCFVHEKPLSVGLGGNLGAFWMVEDKKIYAIVVIALRTTGLISRLV